MLELDHVFCLVAEPDEAARRLEAMGWVLDAGQAHAGQGTRNRRLVWAGRYFELLWVEDAAEAQANPLRLDRRAAWRTTGASPFGLGFRGRVEPALAGDFWRYDALGPTIWIHRDDERSPDRPLVFVLETGEEELARRAQRRARAASVQRRPGELREVRLRGPSAPSLPPYAGPPIVHTPGAHRLELVVADEGAVRPVAEALSIRC